MRFSLNGMIASDDDAEIYRWFGWQAVCPADIRQALADNPPGEEFVLEINSGGGQAYAGFEMYSILRTATVQIEKKKCNTKIEPTEQNRPVFELIRRAEQWLRENTFSNPILKWETRLWGENPADFGRK